MCDGGHANSFASKAKGATKVREVPPCYIFLESCYTAGVAAIPIESWLLGFSHGMRHALEPDHLAAVSTMVTGAPTTNQRSPLRYAVAWGLGHAAMLFFVGGFLFLVRHEMPPRLGDALEAVVAIMLIVLGVRALITAIRAGNAGPPRTHTHDGTTHTHGGVPDHLHLAGSRKRPGLAVARLPFVVGVVHGLAGSGAMTAILAAHQPSLLSGLALLFVYAFGSVAGMAILAGIVGVPLARLAQRPVVHSAVLGLSGLVSTSVGVYWGAPFVASMLGR